MTVATANVRRHAGIFYIILSAILFGTMPLLARVAYSHGSNAYTVAFGRFFLGSVMLGVIILVMPKVSFKIDRAQLKEIVKLSVCYALMPILLYSSYNYIDSGLATTLHFTYPIAVILIMTVFCKLRPDARQMICAVFCIGGLAMLYMPGSQINLFGSVLAVASGIVYAVYIVLLGRSAARGLNPLTLAFWISLLSSVEIGIVALISGKMLVRLDAVGWLAELGMALFATVFALVLFQRGLLLCGEVRASLLSTFEPLTGIVIGVIAFHEIISPREWVGMICILVAAILLVLPMKKRARTRAQ